MYLCTLERDVSIYLPYFVSGEEKCYASFQTEIMKTVYLLPLYIFCLICRDQENGAQNMKKLPC